MKPILEYYFPGNPKRTDFAVPLCGKRIAEKGYAVPPRVYPNHNFSFILKGCGTFRSDFGDFRMTPGKGYFIEGGSTVSYEADEKDPWEYIFVSFCGGGCEDFLKLCGISAEHPVFSFPLEEETLQILNQLLRTARKNRSAGFDTLGYFFLLVSKLISGNGAVTAEDSALHRTQDMVRYIESNYDRNITVLELSKHFFIDRSGIYRSFLEKFGVSPKAYILRYRLTQAAKKLCAGTGSITEIALSCGFFDRSHFNKCFAEYYGTTPGEYRQTHRALSEESDAKKNGD